MLLLVLAVLWGIVLIPPALRNRAEARQGRSVEGFRKRLEVLAPPVPRASRPPSAVRPAGSARPRVALLASPDLPARRTVPTAAKQRPVPAAAAPVPALMIGPAWAPSGPDAPRSSRATVFRRRRRVFAGLCLAAVVTLGVAAALPAVRLPLLVSHLVADLALAAYVTGLRRLRRLARERREKVRYLPVAVPVPAGSGEEVEVEVPAAQSASR